MKKYAMLFLLLLTCSAYAQDAPPDGDYGTRNDIFGAPAFEFSQINGEFAFLAGGRFGWIINHQYVIGAEGYWLANDVPGPSTSSGQKPDLAMGFGGLTLEYILSPYNAVHFSVSNLIGLGAVRYDYTAAADNDDTYWVDEPMLNVYFRITQYFKIGVGVGYRYVADVDLERLEDKDLSGFVGKISLNFGTYGKTLIP